MYILSRFPRRNIFVQYIHIIVNKIHHNTEQKEQRTNSDNEGEFQDIAQRAHIPFEIKQFQHIKAPFL